MGPKKVGNKKANKRGPAHTKTKAHLVTAPVATGLAALAAKRIIGQGNYPLLVCRDETKGRVLVAKKAFKAGEIIFRETAAVHATWHEHRCILCDEEHASDGCAAVRSAFPEAVRSKKIADVEAHLADMAAIQDLDRARCFIKSLYLLSEELLMAIVDLTGEHMERCLECIKEIRASPVTSCLIPETVSDDTAASVLAALNTNSHQLENLGGSGLFQLACVTEHSCVPNSSYTTWGPELWLTATRAIKAGEALSIDYGNGFYKPAAERAELLKSSYGFDCTCELCIKLPDTCRAFVCPAGGCGGPLCPVGDGSAEWVCTTCEYQLSDAERERYLVVETTVAKAPPTSLEAIETVLGQDVLHEYHHLVFWALDRIARDNMQQLAMGTESDELFDSTEEAWERIIELTEATYSEPLHEKAMYYDQLAQFCVLLDDYEAARASWERAYKIMCIVSGKDTAPVLELKALYTGPEKTFDELMEHYRQA